MSIKSLIHIKKILLSPLVIGIVFFLLIQLQIFNLNIDFRDEGLLLSNAVKINQGEIPYKNFPLITTPGTYYIQAFVMKIFGNYIITDRIIYILSFILILILSNKLFKFSSYLNYLFLILLSIVYIGVGAYGFYNIEGLVLILTSFYLFNKLQKKNSIYFYSFLLGIINSLTFIIKQSYGSSAFLIFLLLLIFFTDKKYLVKNLIVYVSGILTIVLPFFLYFYLNDAFDSLVYYVFYFSGLAKSHRMPFLVTSLLFIPFLIFILNVCKKFSFKKIILLILSIFSFIILYFAISPQRINYLLATFTDISTYYFLLFLTLPLILIVKLLKTKKIQDKQILVISILSFCLFLTSATSGRDYATVVVVSPLYIPLFIYILNKACKGFKILTKNIIITFILFLFIFPSVIYMLKVSVNLYEKKMTYSKMFSQEGKYVMLSQPQNKELKSVILYVNNLTLPSKKILCFPYCPILNYLSKLESASYFNFFYPETFRAENQNRVITDLEKANNAIVLVQRPGVIEKEANFEDKRLNVLKKFITNNYRQVKATEDFSIYVK